jgi:hypothetical protein
MRILAIDDDLLILEAIRETMTHLGHHVSTAECGYAGLELLDNGEFDILVLDNNLPDISGIEVLTILRTKYPVIPVLMASGYLREGISLGHRTYDLPKPFTMMALHEKLQGILALCQGE